MRVADAHEFRALLGVFSLLVGVTACGGSASTSSNPGSSSAGSASSTDAPAQCTQFGESVCEDNANCSVETGQITSADRSLFVSSCVNAYNQALDCSKISSASSSTSTCEAELAAVPCSQYVIPTGLPLPASCHGIFQ